jgi:hypothetical protein
MKDHILIYGVLGIFAASFLFLLNKQTTEIEIVPIPIPSPIPQTVNVPMLMTHRIEHSVQSIVDESVNPPSIKIKEPLTIKPQKLQELQKPIIIKKEVPKETEVPMEKKLVSNQEVPIKEVPRETEESEEQIKEKIRKYKFPNPVNFENYLGNFLYDNGKQFDIDQDVPKGYVKQYRYNNDAKLELAFRKFTMVRDDEV